MLTVLFATRNRAEILPEVLNCYCRLESPDGSWKLVIVNNGSTDQTRDIIYSYQQRLPLMYLFEPKLGKNTALNTGLESISGDLVLLTDDDVFPNPDWLVHMRMAADAHPDYAIFGGTILPKWQSTPESWILSWVPLGASFTISDPSMLEGPTTSHNIFGPNMAVRWEVFARGFRFDPQIGPRGPSYAMGSETEFVRRSVKQGFKAWYCRRAVVEHLIPSSHMRMSWILSRAIRFGRGQYRLARREQDQVLPCWLGIPRYIFRETLVTQVRMLIALLVLDGEKLFRARWQLNYLWGQAVEARFMRAEAASVIKLETPILK